MVVVEHVHTDRLRGDGYREIRQWHEMSAMGTAVGQLAHGRDHRSLNCTVDRYLMKTIKRSIDACDHFWVGRLEGQLVADGPALGHAATLNRG